VNLFAYGTLMTGDGVREALGPRADTLAFRPARLSGWRRIWNVYRPEWHGGVLNVEPSPADVVVGILIEGLEAPDFRILDTQEATHLPRETVYVEPFGGDVVPAQVYRRRKGNHAGKPSGRYRTGLSLGVGGVREPVSRDRGRGGQPPHLRIAMERVPAIKVLLLPKDTNALGTIFGGVILSHIDLASAVEARKTAPRRWVTKAMREVEFHEPVFLGDIVNFFTETVRVGRTSITVRVSVEAERWGGGHGERVKVTEAEVVLVSVDDSGRPAPILPDRPTVA
jgi:acyl-CoA thioesterase YciA